MVRCRRQCCTGVGSEEVKRGDKKVFFSSLISVRAAHCDAAGLGQAIQYGTFVITDGCNLKKVSAFFHGES